MEPDSWGAPAPAPAPDEEAAPAPTPDAPSPHVAALSWCEECCRPPAEPECPLHGPLRHIPDSPVPPRAVCTAPAAVSVRRLTPSADGRAVRGVFAATAIACRTLFGPLEAPLLSVPLCLGEDQFLLKKFRAGVESGYLDVSNDKACNWLIYVRPARYWAEQNLVAYQYEDDIYFATCKTVEAQTELKVWYAGEYATLMGVDLLPAEPAVALSPDAAGTRSTPDLSSPFPVSAEDVEPLCTVSNGECEVDGGTVGGRRRKSSRPQRVPQSRQPHIAVVESRVQRQQQQHHDNQRTTNISILPPAAPSAPSYSLILKEDPLCVVTSTGAHPLSLAPAPPSAPTLSAGENILLIYENQSSNGLQQGSLLLLTSGPATGLGQPLLNPSFDLPVRNDSHMQSRPPLRIQPAPSLTFTLSGANQKPMFMGANEESMGDNEDRSMDSDDDDDSNKEHGLSRSSGGGLRPYACSYPACNKHFSSKYKLLRHELIHSQEKRHHCQLCHKKFHRKDHLNNHLKVHERSKVRLECVLCGCVFAKKWTYEKHLALHERDQSRGPIPIRSMEEMGGEGSGAEEEYAMAAETEEEEETEWVTVQQQSPNSAFQPHADDAPEPEEAVECEAVEEPVSQPAAALSMVHTYTGGRKGIPLSQRPSHPCEVCGKVFSASKDLRRHLQTHLGIKPNLCPYCPKKFTRKDHVRRHIQTVHGRSDKERDKSMAPGMGELRVLAQ